MTAAADRYVLAIDLGTTGLKVGIVSVTGTIAWTEDTEIETHATGDGGAEQDAARWWQLVSDAARRGIATAAVRPDQIVAVSTTGQWASTVPVDEAGLPVGPCILWMDTRGGHHARARFGGRAAGYTPRAAATWIRRSGGAPSTSGADPIGHMLHLDRDRPEIARAARWYLEPVDYLAMRFTGAAAASHASMTAAWLTDNRRLTHLDYDPVLVQMSGVDVTKLPPLRPTGSVIGTVRADVAADLGLGPDVAVITGTPDLHSATVGAGTVLDHRCHLAISTTSWISCPVRDKKTDVLHSIATVPGVSADRYLIANNHETSGLCLQWLRDSVFDGAQDYMSLVDAAASASPGAGGVIFTPWLTGERSPVDDHRARAGFHNVSLSTTRADLIRAVLEGVAYNDRWLHGYVERFVKRRLDGIRIFGGGAQSDLWCQIHADVMDRTIERVAEPLHTNLRGAAMLAGLALGDLTPEAITELVPIDATFRPDPANRASYDQLYEEFPRLYKTQRSMFRRLNRRTGDSPPDRPSG